MSNNEQFNKDYLLDLVQADLDFKKEIEIDDEGLPVLSRRAVARLAGVNERSIRKNLISLAAAQNRSSALKPFIGQDFEGAAPLPDTLAYALIIHFAYCAQKTSEIAQFHAAVLGGSKFREWCYQVVGYDANKVNNSDTTVFDLVQRLVYNLEKLTINQNKIIEQSEILVSQHSELIAQQRAIIFEHQRVNNLVLEFGEKELYSIHNEIQARKRRSNIIVLPNLKDEFHVVDSIENIQSMPKKPELKKNVDRTVFNVETENIPLKYLANNLKYFWADTRLALGRNNLYRLFRVKGIFWEHRNEIRPEFFTRGYFVKDSNPNSNVSNTKITFCTPKGYSWLKHRFKTDWAAYVA
ncbi:MAG: hypothetical protein ACFBSE_13765 [Prochloraceae cyanobacterium]